MTAIDLSTAIILWNSGTLTNGVLKSTDTTGAIYFLLPYTFDPTKNHTVEVDMEMFGASSGSYSTIVWSHLGTSEEDQNNSMWYELGYDGARGLAPGAAHTSIMNMGPGIRQWDEAVAGNEMTPLFQVTYGAVSAIRIIPEGAVVDPPPDPDPDPEPTTVGDPRAVSATSTPESLRIAWTRPASEPFPTSYEVSIDGGAPVNVGDVRSHTFFELSPNTYYQVAVRSVAGASTSNWVTVGLGTERPYSDTGSGSGRVGRIVWTNLNARYEQGVDRGVFYPEDGPGLVWNGLTQVEESYVGGEHQPLYLDGTKYLDHVSNRNFQASITAITVPKGFHILEGTVPVTLGMYLTRQPRRRFGFSYRTLIGDGLGYKIHLVYNALATPTGRGHGTISDSNQAAERTWQIDAVPPPSKTHRPTAHFVIDSTKISAKQLETVEGLIYGTEFRDPYLPSIPQIAAIVNYWEPKIVVPDTVGGLSELRDGDGDLIEGDVDGLYLSLPNGRLYESLVRGLYHLTE